MHSKKVTLREKPLLHNRKSLYLDFYPPIVHPKTGKMSRRLFLDLFIYAPVRFKVKKSGGLIPIYAEDSNENHFREQHNATSTAMANHIFSEWRNKLFKPEIYTEFERKLFRQKELGEQCFVKYFSDLIKRRKGANYHNWASTYFYLTEFTKGSIRFIELNEKWCESFKEYLLTTASKKGKKKRIKLSKNTALSYFNKIKAALREAYKNGHLSENLNEKVAPIKPEETMRNFLTIEELRSLAKTECQKPVIRKACLFSSLTGLRYSDIEKLQWMDIQYSESLGYFIRYQQRKTKNYNIIYISKEAYQLLDQPGQPREKVFPGLKYSDINNGYLHKWVRAAEISKHITFHCFRHTYATLQLSAGTDITTISRMLGHKNYKTTEIYAKVIDQSKIDAAEKIKINV